MLDLSFSELCKRYPLDHRSIIIQAIDLVFELKDDELTVAQRRVVHLIPGSLVRELSRTRCLILCA